MELGETRETRQYLTIFVLFLFPACAFLPIEQNPNWDSPSSHFGSATPDPQPLISTDAAKLEAENSVEWRIEQARSRREIVVGMHMHDVRTAWGEPPEILSAGSSSTGNQKWLYYEGVSSRLGIAATREIYFEEGKVVGWVIR